MHYLDFTLDFVPDGKGGASVKVADSPAGQGSLEPFDSPPVEEDLAVVSRAADARLDAERSGVPRSDLDGLERLSAASLRSLGAQLFERLFRGSVRRLFDLSFSRLRPDDGLRIKIQLDLHEQALAPLHTLPWELLFEGQSNHTLGLDQRFSIVRFVPQRRMLDRRELPRPLRILLAGAEPRSARMLSLDDEIERVRKAVEQPGEIEVEPLIHTTPESLRRALTDGKEFHVLHFMGHGDFDSDSGEGEIHLEDGRRGTSKVPGCTLADQLRDRTSLRLVFLNACRTARSTAPNPFSGVAAALVQAGVPAVIAMQFPITDSAAIVFSETVYRCLAAGEPIDTAVTEGRHALAARFPRQLAWGTPVLFLHVPDGRLFVPGRLRPPDPERAPSSPLPLRPLHQLPAPPADFVGREAELAELRGAMSKGGPICSVQGMGGVGKTALALKVAHEFRDDFPDGQIYLDLQGMSARPLTPAEAAAHVIRSFHPEAPLPADSQLAALYREVLHEKRVLLLMDNAADREQIEPLLPPSTCALLITSRQRFSLPGLFRRDLDQLPPDDACALLRRISSRIGDQAASTARLCGDLPFALRVAASTLAERTDLSVADYVQRLEKEGQRAKLGEAALGLGYKLLPEVLQTRFRALAVFPTTFDAAAVATVWNLQGNDDETDESLGELVRRSLLAGEDRRYRLHDLAHAFLRVNLPSAEEEAAKGRHASHYLSVLGTASERYLTGNDGILIGLSLFDRERVHILAGQAWASARTEVSEEAARAAGQFPSVGAHLLKLRLAPQEQIAWVEKGLAAARRLGDRSLEGGHLGGLGIAHAALGETHRAIECFEQHLAISRETGDRLGEGNALGNLGNTYADLGETRKAIELYEQRLEIAREIGDRRGGANASWNLGAAYEKLGEIARAIGFMQACVDFEREVGHPEAEQDAAHVEELRTLESPDEAVELKLIQRIKPSG